MIVSKSIDKFMQLNKGVVAGYTRDLTKYAGNPWIVQLAEGYCFQDGTTLKSFSHVCEAIHSLVLTRETKGLAVQLPELSVTSRTLCDREYFRVMGMNAYQRNAFRVYMSGHTWWKVDPDFGWYVAPHIMATGDDLPSFQMEVDNFTTQFNRSVKA